MIYSDARFSNHLQAITCHNDISRKLFTGHADYGIILIADADEILLTKPLVSLRYIGTNG